MKIKAVLLSVGVFGALFSSQAQAAEWKGETFIKDNGTPAVSEWVRWDNKDYFIDYNGKYVKNTWIGDYYMENSGRLAKDEWIITYGNWYKVDSTGKCITNNIVEGYYLGNTGRLAKNEWVLINNKWGKTDSTGKLLKNQWAGEYFLNQNGVLASNEWIISGNGAYYIKADGSYAHDCNLVIGGDTYHFNSAGRAGNPTANSGQYGGATTYSEYSDGRAEIFGFNVPIVKTSATSYGADNVLYEYTPIANFYAAERLSDVGSLVFQLGTGSSIYIDGVNYSVKSVHSGISKSDYTTFYNVVDQHDYDKLLQTCENGTSHVRLYKLVKI